MNADSKKTVLRMIPYGIYVLTADDGKGNVAAATVNWVTQTAFAPPLVVLGVKTDSGAYQTLKAAKTFALNMLGKDQKSLAFTFFRPADVSDGKLSGQAYRKGTTGAPLLVEAPGAVECKVDQHRRAGRPSHRGGRGDRGPSQQAAGGTAGRGDPRDEGSRRQRVLRRVVLRSRRRGFPQFPQVPGQSATTVESQVDLGRSAASAMLARRARSEAAASSLTQAGSSLSSASGRSSRHRPGRRLRSQKMQARTSGGSCTI